jgi:hypothetical protein
MGGAESKELVDLLAASETAVAEKGGGNMGEPLEFSRGSSTAFRTTALPLRNSAANDVCM